MGNAISKTNFRETENPKEQNLNLIYHFCWHNSKEIHGREQRCTYRNNTILKE